MTDYAKESLAVAARLGKSQGHGGVSEDAETPDFAAAIGLMMIDSDGGSTGQKSESSYFKNSGGNAKQNLQKASGTISKFLGRFKV